VTAGDSKAYRYRLHFLQEKEVWAMIVRMMALLHADPRGGLTMNDLNGRPFVSHEDVMIISRAVLLL
jgi:hypothetical protein